MFGVRKVAVYGCPNEGKFVYEFEYCSLKQTANNREFGSFKYDDFNDAINYVLNDRDKSAEVSAYYHVTKAYKYFSDLKMDSFRYLKSSKDMPLSEIKPFIVVVNFRNSNAFWPQLLPIDNAHFVKKAKFRETITGVEKIKEFGDALILGQGKEVDYAFDGDVIYHEFGHALVYSLSKMSFAKYAFDKYGVNVNSDIVNEAYADTFSFIITEDPCLAEYVAHGFGKRCIRDNSKFVEANEDFSGEPHNDSMAISNFHFKLFELSKKEGISKDDFSKLIINSLENLKMDSFGLKSYAINFLKTVKKNKLFRNYRREIIELMVNRGLFKNKRVSKIRERIIKEIRVVNGPSVKLVSMKKRRTIYISPLQYVVHLKEGESGFVIDGLVKRKKKNFNLLVRKDIPILYNYKRKNEKKRINFDHLVKYEKDVGWKIDNLSLKSKYYIQFIRVKIGADRINDVEISFF